MTRDPIPTKQYDVVIVGGGISGLAAAWELRDLDICVLEAAEIVGGRLKSEVRGTYWLNLGAHVLKASGPMATLAGDVKAQLLQPPGHFLAVAMDGHVIRTNNAAEMIFRLPLSISARLSLAGVGLKILCAQAMSKSRLEGMTFGALLGRMHPDVEGLMRVVANRLTGELTNLSARAAVNGFNHLWLGSRLNIAGGSAELPRALQKALGDRVRTNTRVTSVRDVGSRVEVECAHWGQFQSIEADACVVAVPAPIARTLIADLTAEHDDALAHMRYSPFVVAGLFTNETGTMPWDDLYALAVPDKSFCMLFNPANPLRHGNLRRPGGGLVVYAVADRAAQLMELSDCEIQQRYLSDLYAIFPQARGIVSEVIIQRWPNGTALGYPNRAAYREKLAGGCGRIAFAGDYMMPIDGVDASETGGDAAWTIRRRILKNKGIDRMSANPPAEYRPRSDDA